MALDSQTTLLIVIVVVLVLLLLLSSYTMYRYGKKSGMRSSVSQSSEEHLHSRTAPIELETRSSSKRRTTAVQSVIDSTVATLKDDVKFSNTAFSLSKDKSAHGSDSTGSTTWADTKREMSIPGFLEVKDDCFRIIQKLGSGGTSGVYLAEVTNEELDQRCKSQLIVVKSLSISGTRRTSREKLSNNMITPFLQEVSMMSYFRSSPYFASIVGYTRDPPMILQKYYRFGTLFDYLHRPHRFPVDQVNSITRPKYTTAMMLRFSEDLAKALQSMHSSGLVHHDIKTPNLLLDYNMETRNWGLVLTDFGVSKVADSQSLLVKAFTPIKPAGATIVYASPELLEKIHRNQKDDNEEADTRVLRATDVYAYGIVLFEITVRKIPWRKSSKENKV